MIRKEETCEIILQPFKEWASRKPWQSWHVVTITIQITILRFLSGQMIHLVSTYRVCRICTTYRIKNHKLHIDFFIWKSKFAYCCCQVVVLSVTGGLLFYTLHGVPHTHVQDSPPGRDITVIITTCYLGNITAEHIIRDDILLCNLGNKLLDMSYELFISV